MVHRGISSTGWYPIPKLLRLHDGIIYGKNIQFNDLTKERAALLIDDDRRSVEMLYDSARHMCFDQLHKRTYQVTITGKTITNYLTNPSFEDVTAQSHPNNWTILAYTDCACIIHSICNGWGEEPDTQCDSRSAIMVQAGHRERAAQRQTADHTAVVSDGCPGRAASE